MDINNLYKDIITEIFNRFVLRMNQQCIFRVNDRSYNQRWIEDSESNQIYDTNMKTHLTSPTIPYWFDGEVINLNTNQFIKSKIRDGEKIPGILVLTKNKTYGTYSKSRRFLYKFIPNNVKLPYFLVPYEMKYTFNKKYIDKYVVITFKEWTSKNIHPIGTIHHMVGDVSINEHIYEYLIWCKKLNDKKSTFKKAVHKMLTKERTPEEWIELIKTQYPIEDRRTTHHIVSVDPPGCVDIDDAYSVQSIDQKRIQLSVYIANVPLYMDAMGLWSHIHPTQNPNLSTIYFPDKKQTMIPTSLSDNLCSLLRSRDRVALTMDITYDMETKHIGPITWKNTLIHLAENLSYDDETYLNSPGYHQVKEITTELNKLDNYRYLVDGIKDSHEVIQYLMILFNCEAAKRCDNMDVGIFRVMKLCATLTSNQSDKSDEILPKDVRSFRQIWNSSGSVYCTKQLLSHPDFVDNTQHTLTHDMIGTTAYLQMSSPIRRMVDLLNMTIFMEKTGLFGSVVSNFRVELYDAFIESKHLKKVNQVTKDIRRVQNECALIDLVDKTPELLKMEHEGYIVDQQSIMLRNQTIIQYQVYLHRLKVCKTFQVNVDKMVEEDVYKTKLPHYTKLTFKLHFFNDYASMKKKWVLNII